MWMVYIFRSNRALDPGKKVEFTNNGKSRRKIVLVRHLFHFGNQVCLSK